jgi:type II secretory pathway component GspD/PulD (secretin)
MNAINKILASLLLLLPLAIQAQPGPPNPQGFPFSQAAAEDAGPVSVLISGPVTLLSPAQAGNQNRPAAAEPGPVDPRIRTVDLLTLVADIAADIDKEIIIHPGARGSLSYMIGDDAPDYETLLAILRTNGLAALETDEQIRIVPEATMRSEPTRVLQEDDRRVSDHEIVTRIINVDGISAAQMVPILRPMMPQYAQLGTVQGTSQLVIVDRYDNVRRLTRIVAELVASYEPPAEE